MPKSQKTSVPAHGQQIDQDVINRSVWKACDTMRGAVAPENYKNYVLALLFLKYISDVWHDHHELAGTPLPTAAETIFALPQAADFDALCKKAHLAGNAKRIDAALAALERENDGKLHGVFQGIRFQLMCGSDEDKREETLCTLLAKFSKPELNLRPSRVGSMDVIGNVYEYLIKHFAAGSGKKAGEFYTPPEVSQLMAMLLDPQNGETIYDPTCGSGSLLMKCGQFIRQHNPAAHYQLFGQESLDSTWALAKMNMFLHGEPNHRLELGDTLRTPRLLQSKDRLMQFDVVVANPPFSIKDWGVEKALNDPFQRFERGVPPDGKADFAFILHMLASMKPDTGRMAVVVPSGVLFRLGAEGTIRENLVQENLIDTVISLPEKLFFGTDLGAAIMVLKRHKTDDKILFINASELYIHEKKQYRFRPQDLQQIVQACQDRRSQENFCYLASRDEVMADECNLTVQRFAPITRTQTLYDLQQLAQQAEQLEQQRAANFEKIKRHLRRFGIDGGKA